MIIKRTTALNSVAAHALWIAADNLRVADRFFDAVERTLRLLERSPLAGRVFQTDHTELQRIRKLRVVSFPRHLIFYQPIDGGIKFITLIHTSMNIAAALQEQSDIHY
jgi:plasmid stabilization system protein ParE